MPESTPTEILRALIQGNREEEGYFYARSNTGFEWATMPLQDNYIKY